MTPELKALVEKKAELYMGTGVAEDIGATYTVEDVQLIGKNAFAAGAELLASVLGEYEAALEKISKNTFEANPWTVLPTGDALVAREALAAGRRILEGKP